MLINYWRNKMSFSINVQKLKKYNYVSYSMSVYSEEDGWKDEPYKEYDFETWDIEGWKKWHEGYGGEYTWCAYGQTHPIQGNLLDISIYDGLFIMNIDGNLVRIPVDAIDEVYENDNSISFDFHGGEDYRQLYFCNRRTK